MLFIQRLCTALNEQDLLYAVAGGHAVAFHGAPRGTIDIDFVAAWKPENLVGMQSVFSNLGLISKQPLEAIDVYQFRDEYVSKRGLISWNFYNPNNLTENVDIVVTFDLQEGDAITLDVGDVQVPVLKLEKLIDMKRASKRDQDRFDLEALLAIQKRTQRSET